MRKLRVRRKAISPMIGGVIVLALMLTALLAVVLVSQQFDQYQTQANKMSQVSNQQLSEDLDFNSPGLTLVTSNPTIAGWGSGCTTTYNCYAMTISNVGGIGVQIVRIYINSTGPAGTGCSSPNKQPCILNPTLSIASYAFNQANQFVNPAETNHTVFLALPGPSPGPAVTLPNPNPAFPENAVVIVTSRGNAFAFQWPFQVSIFGQSQSAFSQGNMKIAYTGSYDSAKEPGHGGSGGTGYCHQEVAAPYPAAAGYAEELTGVTGYGDSGVLWFVNPWITSTILESSGLTFYIYVVVVNTGLSSYNPTAGTLDMTWYGSNHIDGSLIGVYYNGAFYPAANAPSIAPGAYYYAIFSTGVGGFVTVGTPPTASVMWWGGASITNGLNSNAEGQSYFSGTVLVSGLWIRYEATSGSCA